MLRTLIRPVTISLMCPQPPCYYSGNTGAGLAPHPHRLVAARTQQALCGCLSGRQKTRPRAALLHWLAIGSWDRNSICLGLRGPTAQHRPGNRTPLGELEEFIVWPLPPCPSIAWDSLGQPVPPGISIWVWFRVGVCFHSGQSDPNPDPNTHLTPTSLERA